MTEPIPAGTAPALSGSDLCTRCGLCCHGVLHEWGELEEEEVERVRAAGVGLERMRDRLVFSLPCSRVDGTVCTVYEHRPDACRGYRCALLRRYEEGEIALGDAVQLVGQAHALLDTVKSRLQPGESYRDFKTAWRDHMSGDKRIAFSGAERSQRSGAFMALAMLSRFIDRHFRLDRETLLVSPERNAELLREARAEKDASA